MENKKITYGQAVSLRVKELLEKEQKTKYWLALQSGIPHSTLKAIVDAKYDFVEPKAIMGLCRAFKMEFVQFYDSPYFYLDFLQYKD